MQAKNSIYYMNGKSERGYDIYYYPDTTQLLQSGGIRKEGRKNANKTFYILRSWYTLGEEEISSN